MLLDTSQGYYVILSSTITTVRKGTVLVFRFLVHRIAHLLDTLKPSNEIVA